MSKIKDKINRNESVSMADIKEHKQEVLKKIRLQQNVIKDKAELIISPIADTGSSLISSFSFGKSTFETFMLGYRIVKGITRLFSRKRRY